jgi:hypothetical protein
MDAACNHKNTFPNSARLLESMSSFDREDDLALDVTFGGSFVCLASVGKRKGAVQDDADRPVIEQAPDFRQLSPARTDLGCRDRDAQWRDPTWMVQTCSR